MSTRRSINHNTSFRSENGTSEGGRAQWSTQAFTVENVVKQFALPQIVKCSQQSIMMKKHSPLPVNLAQPILLYQKRDIRKLLARNVVMDPVTQRFAENDETIVIPADYEGQFLRLNSRTAKDSSSHHSIESLARNHVHAFITLTKLTAFVIGPHPQSSEYTKIDYTPGNIFLVDRVYLGTTRIKSEGKLFNFHNNSVTQIKYLKCRDEKDVDILIPLSHTGEFIEVLKNQGGNGRLSVDSRGLISTSKFPTLVRFVSSKRRPRLTTFSGFFTLIDSFEETTLFGCVIDPRGFTMLELPLSSPLTFQLALNTSDLFLNPVVKKANRHCEASCTEFCKDLKFKFKFAQRIVQTSGRIVGPLDESDPTDDVQSVTNSARFGVTATHIYF